MTRKDYHLIAQVINEAIQKTRENQLNEPIRFIAHNLADALYNDNNRFDYTRFFKACDLE